MDKKTELCGVFVQVYVGVPRDQGAGEKERDGRAVYVCVFLFFVVSLFLRSFNEKKLAFEDFFILDFGLAIVKISFVPLNNWKRE